MATALNRTTQELKRKENFEKFKAHWPLNRTTQELKPACRHGKCHPAGPLNRTTQELKPGMNGYISFTHNALNRTTQELKRDFLIPVELLYSSQSHHTGIETGGAQCVG